MILLRPALFPRVDFAQPEVCAPGRITRVQCDVSTSGQTFRALLLNIYSFGVTAAQRRAANAQIKADRILVGADPTRCSLWLAGDLNFCNPARSETAARTPEKTWRDSANHVRRPLLQPLPALRSLTEVMAADHTRYAASKRSLPWIGSSPQPLLG